MTPPARPTAIRPFRALHYSGQRVRLEEVVAPPYDVISAEERERLLARSPYNVVRLILPDPGTERGVNRLFCAWQREHVVVQDPVPCLYRVEQDFVGPDGIAHTRSGFIALVRLEPYEARVVRPHERTYEGPKEGRLRLLRATRTQLSPVFALYDDPSGRAETALVEGSEPEPEIDVTDAQGTRHRLWRVPSNHEPVAEVVAAGPLLIADGHHRYETALAYLAERDGEDDPAAAWTMMYLANAASPSTCRTAPARSCRRPSVAWGSPWSRGPATTPWPSCARWTPPVSSPPRPSGAPAPSRCSCGWRRAARR
jgi:uncharacterized protein (DUF1015 family)